MPILLPPLALSGILQYSWVDRFGSVHDLTYQSSPRLFVDRGTTGLGTPGVELVDDKLPQAAGSLVRRIGTQPRRIELPIHIREDTLAELIARVDQVRNWFYTGDERLLQPGYLRVTRPNDEIRQLQCYYAGGLDGDMDTGSPVFTRFIVSLYAPDPWPTAPAADTAGWLSTDVDLPTVSVLNDGELDAYPIWTITGPATQVNVNNTTTGKGWLYSSGLVGFNLAAGKTLTIDSRPASFRTTLPVLDSDGVSRYTSFHPASSMFTLQPGTNNLDITFVGNSGATRLDVEWVPHYQGLLR